MSEALPEDPSIEQIASNIHLAELLASGGGADVSSLSTTHQSQEEIRSLLENHLTSHNKSVQVGLLERYMRICRKSSTNYPPFPITGIKACLYILKVSTEKTDVSIKEKLAVVIETWRATLEQEIGPVLAGSPSIWTCKALTQLTGRSENSTNSPITNSGKRKRSQDSLSGVNSQLIPSSSPLPQRCRTASSRISESLLSQQSPGHLTPNNLSGPKDPKEVTICTNLLPSESSQPTSMKTITNYKQDPVNSSSNNPVKTVQLPLLQTSSSAAPVTSRPLPSPSVGSSSALQPSQVHMPLPNTLSSQVANPKTGPQPSVDSQSQISRVTQNINHPIEAPTPAANHLANERDKVSRILPVPNGLSANPPIPAQADKWQRAFRRLDLAVTELLESIPLTPVVSLSESSFYKPIQFSPAFQWTPPSVSSYVNPPGLSLTNIPPIVTFRPQLELHNPPAKPSNVPTPDSSRQTDLGMIRIASEKQMSNASSFPPVTLNNTTHGKPPTPASPAITPLPPTRPSSTIQPAPSSSLVYSNQSSSIQPNLHQFSQLPGNVQVNNIQPGLQQPGQLPVNVQSDSIQPSRQQSSQSPGNVPVEPQPIFNVTVAQKMKFVDTYRRVDASGKAKLEATLRKNKLWDVLAPLLTPSAIGTPTATTTPQNASPAPQPQVNAVSTPLNQTTVQNSLSSTPMLHSTPKKSDSASTVVPNAHVPAVATPKQFDSCTVNSESSNAISQSASPQIYQGSIHASYLNSAAPFNDGALDPVLTKMILAMLAAEPQATNVLMVAFESLGIRNRDAIMTHLKALAVPVNGVDDFWQLRTQAGLASPATVLPDSPSIASHPQLTPKPANPITVPTMQSKHAPQPDRPLTNGIIDKSTHAAFNPLLHPSAKQDSPSRLGQPKAHPQDQNAVGHGTKEHSGENPIQSSKAMNGARTEAMDEIEVLEVVDRQKTNTATSATDMVSEKKHSSGPAKKRITPISSEWESKKLAFMGDGESSKRPSSIGRRGEETPVNNCQASSSSTKKPPHRFQVSKDMTGRHHFNILDDGLPGFPDVDPSFQIHGAPARVLARYPPDQQMPPVRTFVPLLKKSQT
ncbi:hypothetical protein PGT21_023724 [Puccinia graminis f. sp. tritici]|uniref:Uncharacterized protein n=1 Tax=Puccinia graminis f. sp. tritici TaxID=56615 RepID=A0A5B0R1K9_PUCGR|nr:hypothetical protein PGT21_023724 [Puccinia graminis f. sp. tritici]